MKFQITTIKAKQKSLKYCKNHQNVRDTNWANAVGKMVLIHFLDAGLRWMLNFFFFLKHYLWCTIKPGMSVFMAIPIYKYIYLCMYMCIYIYTAIYMAVPIYKSTRIRTQMRTVSMRMYVSILSAPLKQIHLCKQEQTLGKWPRFSGAPQAAHNNRTVSSKPQWGE